MMNSLRVLMISDVYFPRVNGVSTSIQTFRDDLAALGCESALIAPAYPQSTVETPDVYRVRSRRVPFDAEDRLPVRRALLARARALAPHFDLVHVQTPFVAHRVGVKLAREQGLPVVESYHTYFEQYFHHYLPLVPASWLRAAARRFSRSQCDAVDAVIAPSAQMAAVLADYGVRAPVEVIPTGLDMENFAGADGARFRQAHGIDPNRPVMLHVGRLAHEKNIGFIIDVLARVRAAVPDVLLVLAGEGPAFRALTARVESRGLSGHVEFVGYLDRAGPLLDCYASANAFVFASNTETQGLVVLEAMACGTPVVSTAVMGTAAVLEGADGAVVVDEHVQRFAGAVTALLKDKARQAELGGRARRFVAARWSSACMAERLLGLYGSLVPSVSSRARSRAPFVPSRDSCAV